MLQVKNLIKSYGKNEVLKGISFSVKAGQTAAVMGPSGCGKSTMIRCLNQLTKFEEGKIIFNGVPIGDLTFNQLLKIRQQIGFVFQNFNLIARLTVRENVILPLLKFDLSPQERIKKAEAMLEEVRLKDKSSAYPHNLSGGEKQRVGIARALIINPQLILLDEPTASLDPILVREVMETIEEITRGRKRAVLLVTHEVNFALKIADKILLLDDGKIVERGESRRIFADPQSEIGKKYKALLDYY